MSSLGEGLVKLEGDQQKKEKREQLASVVKHVHNNLKRSCESEENIEQVWKKHRANTDLLNQYATAMHRLATEVWNENDSSSRVKWCHDYVESYFYGDVLKKIKLKDLRRLRFHSAKEENDVPPEAAEEVNMPLSGDEKVRLLDVGSCYDAFRKYEKFSVVALDLCPATESVYRCDFLELQVDPSSPVGDIGLPSQKVSASSDVLTSQIDDSERPSREICSLPSEKFHVVLFSLLLDYLPSPAQRFTCCIKAHCLLALDGILVVICPDSRKQHRNGIMVKDWRQAIESIGFKRCHYKKLQHLHCMAFRKVSNSSTFALEDGKRFEARDECQSRFVELMGLPRDKQTGGGENGAAGKEVEDRTANDDRITTATE